MSERMNDSDVKVETLTIGNDVERVRMTHIPTGIRVTGTSAEHTRELLEVLVWDDAQPGTTAKCPVCVFTAANMPPDDLAGLKCWNCGGAFSKHPVRVSSLVPPGVMYAYDPIAARVERA